MMKKRFVILCLAALLVMSASVCLAADKAALEAADSFLSLVDSGNYAQSWDQASAFFKSKVNEKAWVQQLGQARKPFGAIKVRKVLVAKDFDKLPNAPAGQYAVIEYAAAFADKNANETLTMMRQADGSWRMAGYYIRPVQ